MKEVIITEWDDYDLLHEGRKVHAENTVLIGVDGKWRELDLSDPNVQKFHEMFDPWWLCGRTPEKEVGKGPLMRTDRDNAASNGSGQHVPPAGKGHRGSPERRAFLKGLRDWADARGLNYTTKGTSADGNVHGSYYYPQSLIIAYNEYLEQQAALARAGQEQAVQDNLPGMRTPCSLCRHPRSLHRHDGEEGPCTARGCHAGPDGTPCGAFVGVQQEAS